MRLALKVPRPSSAISLTPLIDVVFILLLFFMLATDFSQWRTLPIRTATTERAANATSDQVLPVHITSTAVRVGTHAVALDQLGQWLGQQSVIGASMPSAMISSDDDVRLQQLVWVLDSLNAAGFRRVRLNTDQQPARGNRQ